MHASGGVERVRGQRRPHRNWTGCIETFVNASHQKWRIGATRNGAGCAPLDSVVGEALRWSSGAVTARIVIEHGKGHQSFALDIATICRGGNNILRFRQV